jgi:hypothetical protein
MIQGIIEILSEDTNVLALVGTYGDNIPKVFPVRAPQQAIADNDLDYWITASKDVSTPNDAKACDGGLDSANVTVMIYGQEYSKVDDIYEAVRAALNQRAYTTDAGINLASMVLVSDYDAFDDNAQRIVRVSKYLCFHNRMPT